MRSRKEEIMSIVWEGESPEVDEEGGGASSIRSSVTRQKAYKTMRSNRISDGNAADATQKERDLRCRIRTASRRSSCRWEG
jgi:hypothetical protein